MIGVGIAAVKICPEIRLSEIIFILDLVNVLKEKRAISFLVLSA